LWKVLTSLVGKDDHGIPYAEGVEYTDRNPGGHLSNADEGIARAIESWARDTTAPPVYWLNKSNASENTAIARVVAGRMSTANRLGASFFCSQVVEGRNLHLIFPTLAHQLACEFPNFYCHPPTHGPGLDVSKWRMAKQMTRLILTPSVVSNIDTVIIIDALDASPAEEGDRFDFFPAFEEDLPHHIKFLITAPREDKFLRRKFHNLAKSKLAVIYDTRSGANL
jgi:hypothetical protein